MFSHLIEYQFIYFPPDPLPPRSAPEFGLPNKPGQFRSFRQPGSTDSLHLCQVLVVLSSCPDHDNIMSNHSRPEGIWQDPRDSRSDM